jgi:uncharacterized protein YjbI with pentapeptide repeats
VADFTRTDLSDARFDDVYLTGANFHDVDLSNARFHDLTGAVIRGAALVNVDIDGEIDNLRSTASTSSRWWRPS